MGQRADELRRDIDGTRDHLGATVDAIEDRVSPRRVVERRRSAMADRWSSVRDSVMGRAEHASDRTSGALHDAPDTARHEVEGNPLAAGLVAFGAGLLAATLIPVSDAERQAAGRLAERAEPLREEAQRVGGEVGADLREEGGRAAAELRETARHGAEEVRGTAVSAGQDVREHGTHAVDETRGEASASSDRLRDR